MTWAGETPQSGVYTFTEDGSPGAINGNQGDLIRWGATGTAEFVNPGSITGVFGRPPFTNVITVDTLNPVADFSTIQAALNSAVDGTHILIGPGSYPEELLFPSGINVMLEGIGSPLNEQSSTGQPQVLINPAMTAANAAAIKNDGNLLQWVALKNLHIRPTWDGATGPAYGIFWGVLSSDQLTIIDCVVNPTCIGTAPQGALVALRSENNGTTKAYRSVFKVDDNLSQLPAGINTLEVDGGSSDIFLDGCSVRDGQGADPPAQIQIDGGGEVYMRNTVCDGALVSLNSGDRYHIDTHSQWSSLVGMDDTDTDVILDHRGSGLVYTNGQNDQYKVHLRDIAGTPGALQDGNIWYDGTNLRGREAGTDFNLNSGGGGSGISGPGSSTDNAIARWDGTGGDTLEDSEVLVTDSGSIVDPRTITFRNEFDNFNGGASATVNWNEGQKQQITLTDDTAFSFVDPPNVCSLLLRVIQDGTGNREPTWPTGVLWPNGNSPNFTNQPGSVDIVTFYFNGTHYYSVATLDFS
jgi:hypothetical protein